MNLRLPKGFKLEKLYLDCIDDSGNCFIIYNAKIAISFFSFDFSSVIFSDPDGFYSEKSSLKKSAAPLTDEDLTIENRWLEIKGTWEADEKPLPLFIYKEEINKSLKWNCHHPRTKTRICFKGRNYSGYGYADTVSLTLKPWQLPVKGLKWGRFLSKKYTIVWMVWAGSSPVNKIYLNNTEFNDALFRENEIVFGKGSVTLVFDDIKTIREQRLSAILAERPWLRPLFPESILNVNEFKFKAKSTLRINSEIISTGWSLYENVLWGN